METWKIIVFVVILILPMLGAWYAIKLQREDFEKRVYVYPKTGHRYMPLFRCRLKCPTSGQWFDALIYQDYDSKHLYVREKKDFFDKFVKLTEYNNGNNSKQGVSETD